MKNEVSELWITFHPQPKDEKGTKRITSPIYIERYKNILKLEEEQRKVDSLYTSYLKRVIWKRVTRSF